MEKQRRSALKKILAAVGGVFGASAIARAAGMEAGAGGTGHEAGSVGMSKVRVC